MEVQADGMTVEGERWQLGVETTPRGVMAWTSVTAVDGRRCSGTGASVGLSRDGPVLGGSWGWGDSRGPHELLLWLSPVVRAVVVRLSDGTREDLRLLGDVDALGARVAVLFYPRHLDVHRIDLYGADGALLPHLPGP